MEAPQKPARTFQDLIVWRKAHASEWLFKGNAGFGSPSF